MFPSEDVIAHVFASPSTPQSQPDTPALKRREPFPAWSVAEEATREIEAASKSVQAKAGKIEPWTAKYYAACTVGGLLACVSSRSDTLRRCPRY